MRVRRGRLPGFSRSLSPAALRADLSVHPGYASVQDTDRTTRDPMVVRNGAPVARATGELRGRSKMRTTSCRSMLTPLSTLRLPPTPLRWASTTRVRSSGTMSVAPAALLLASSRAAGPTRPLDNDVAANVTAAQGINNAGQIVGYYQDGGHLAHGFLYSGGTYFPLDDPSATLGTSGQLVRVPCNRLARRRGRECSFDPIVKLLG